MSTQANAINGNVLEAEVPAREISPADRFLWLIRRELWEYRVIYIAPLVAAVVFLFGFLLNLMRLPERARAAMAMDAVHRQQEIAYPHDLAAGLLLGVWLLIAAYYCVDTLYGERRERSILFWKSLPVSDGMTVAAKASIALMVLPALAWAVVTWTQIIMYVLNAAALSANGMSLSILTANVPLLKTSLLLLYHLVTVHVLWWAPFYGWLLLVSAWARKAPLVWAVLPPFALGVIEKVAFGTSHFANWLQYRFTGPGTEAVTMPGTMPTGPMTEVTPLSFFVVPGLWLGLALTAAMLFATARLRRYRGPN